MAFTDPRLNQYEYFRSGGRFDQSLIENTLLPGLSTQSSFARASLGIELPHGEGQTAEFIPPDIAADLVLNWFIYERELESDDAVTIKKLFASKKYREAADTIQVLFRQRVDDPQKLLKDRLVQNVAELERVKALAEQESHSTSTFRPATAIIDYNRLAREVQRLAGQGVPLQFIERLLPPGLSDSVNNLQVRQMIINLASQPEMLALAATPSHDAELRGQALVNQFERQLDQYPEYDGIRNFTGTDSWREGLVGLADHINDRLTQEGVSLDEYAGLKRGAGAALPHLLPDQAALLAKLESSLPFTTQADKTKFARSLMAVMVSSSGSSLTTGDLVALAARETGATATQITAINSLLHSTELGSALEYHQNELHLDMAAGRLTASQKSLRAKGINPFHAYGTTEDLLKEAHLLLGLPASSLSSQDAQVKIRELYERQSNSASPNRVELSRLRGWLDRQHTLSYLDLPENDSLARLASRSRFERRLSDTSSRFSRFQTSLYDKWGKFEENLPWNKAMRKGFEWYDKLADKTILTVGKTKIPLLRLIPWALDQWDLFKKVTTSKLAASLRGKNWGFFDPLRRRLNFVIREYRLGDHTTSGALFHYGHKVWGQALSWAAAKTGMSSVFKYAGKTSAGLAVRYTANAAARIAVRFLLKIGGKALAKIGIKAITALLAAGTIIGGIFSAVAIISLVFDLLKLGYDFVKRFIQDVNFRKMVLKIGATVGAVVLAIQSLPWAVLVAALLAPILLACAVSLILVASFTLLFNTSKMTMQLDSGVTQFITSILCQNSEEGPASTASAPTAPPLASSSIISCASCLVDYLTACYGQEVTGSDMQTTGIGCLLAKAVAPDVAAEIEASAIGYDYLQCVGFVQAAVTCSGGSLEGRAVAADYITNPSAGYSYVSGAGSCQPGDIGLIDGDIGHIFIVGSNNNATINALDANYVCSGCVSSNTPLPASSVAGCMKKL